MPLPFNDIPSNIPTIVQLQTLMNDPKFKENYLERRCDGFQTRHELAIMMKGRTI